MPHDLKAMGEAYYKRKEFIYENEEGSIIWNVSGISIYF